MNQILTLQNVYFVLNKDLLEEIIQCETEIGNVLKSKGKLKNSSN